tara:strand:+ start:1750 stop:2292 length:543 start_codon:yes stop_codon:yes gene_type:complete
MQRKTAERYFNELMMSPRVIQFLDNLGFKQLFIKRDNQGNVISPKLEVVNKTSGALVAGEAYGSHKICLAKWILADDQQTKAVIRHELAHLLHKFSGMGGNSHGQEYNSILKMISPNRWRKDRHWYPTVSIEKARSKVHRVPMVNGTSMILKNRASLTKSRRYVKNVKCNNLVKAKSLSK